MSAPPTDFARLELFCELVDEYDALSRSFPVDSTSFAVVPVSETPAPERWDRIVRAMALRKFILTKSDNVHVAKVLNSVEACLVDRSLIKNLEQWRIDFTSVARQMRIVEGPGLEISVPEIIEDMIYGGLLHGDYDRRLRVNSRPHLTHDLSLFQFVTGSEHYVRELRDVIRGSVAEELLAPRGAEGLPL